MIMLRTIGAIVVLLATSVVGRTQDKLFDNFNTNACGFTDNATFTLRTSAHVNQIQVWYNWQNRESSVRYSILRHNQTIQDGVLARAECDPYQNSWCLASARVEINLDPGEYTIRTAHPKVCQNRGSNSVGFVKVFGRFTRIHE